MGIFGSAAGAMFGGMGNTGGNGGSFAQKQQMNANPMMRGRPAMSAGAQIGANMMKNKQSMQPNPLTGARPGMQQQGMSGMQGPNKFRMNQPIGGSMASQPPAMSNQFGPQRQTQYPDQPGYDPGVAGPMKPGGLSSMPVGGDEPRAHDMGPNNIGANAQWKQLMGGMMGDGMAQAHVMPRSNPDMPFNMNQGLGPSLSGMNSLYGSTPGMQTTQPMQQLSGMGPMQPNEPVQMDENGLEPRRGPR